MLRRLLLGILLTSALSGAWAAETQVLEIEVSGMTCPFCVYGTEKKLAGLPGVDEVMVSLEQKKARVTMLPGQKADVRAIKQAITDAGFTPGEVRIDDSTGTHP